MKRQRTLSQVAYYQNYEDAKRRRIASRAATSSGQVALTRSIVRNEMKRRGDLKYVDRSGALQNMTSSGTFIKLFGTQFIQGSDGLNNYDGNTISMNGVTLKFAAQSNQNYNFCRIMVFQWLDSSVPVLSGILQDTSTGIATVSATLVTNKSFLKVLYDKTWAFAPTADSAVTVGNAVFSDQCYIPGSRLAKVRMDASTDATCQKGQIYLMYLSDDSVTTYPQLTYYFRGSFYDD